MLIDCLSSSLALILLLAQGFSQETAAPAVVDHCLLSIQACLFKLARSHVSLVGKLGNEYDDHLLEEMGDERVVTQQA